MNTAPVISEDRDLPTELRTLSDLDLLAQTSRLARDERAATIQILHHLNEIVRRKLYLELGYGSLHDYCVRGLCYSSPSACRRIQAARCIREHAQVLPLLESGELDLGTVYLIEPVLTEENRDAILSRVCGTSYRQVKRVVAEYGAPVVTAAERIEPVRTFVTPADVDTLLLEREIDRGNPYPQEHHPGSWVVSEQKMLVQFLASEELIAKYEEAKALLSNSHPGAGFAEVLDVLLREFIERHSPQARQTRRDARKAAAAERSSKRSGKFSTVGADGSSRRIPIEVRDEVHTRDGGRCTYVAPNGTRCRSTRALQIDHVKPFAAGGTNDSANLRLLCAAHNRLAAEQTLGRHIMSHYWRRQ